MPRKKPATKLRAVREAGSVSEPSPAFINSSYTVFFIAFTLVWAKVLSGYFPDIMQTQAYIVMVAFSLMLLVFRYLLLQFYNGVTILKMLVLYFGLSALLAFISAVTGPLASGQVPYLHILFLAKLVVISAPSLVVGSVLPFYGAITLILALWSAVVLELVYNAVSRVLPKPLRRALHLADARIDKAAEYGSAQLYIEQEWKGVIAVVLLLIVYAVIYCTVVIF